MSVHDASKRPRPCVVSGLCDETQINWTFFSPAASVEETPRLDYDCTGTDQLVVEDKGESRIGFANHAIAMIEELERPKHNRVRFTAAN